MRFCLMAVLVLAAGPALAAPALEAWNCRLPSGPQHWAVDGDLLVSDMAGLPVSMTRLPIVKNSDDAVMAVSDEYAGRRFEIVLIDKLAPAIRILTLGAQGGVPSGDSGPCVSGFARQPVPAAGGAPAGRAVPAAPFAPASTVRPLIRKLLQQAENLTAQGFYDAALRKVRETDEFPRQTAEEKALVAQTRAYVMQKSGGKAR